MFVLTVHLAAPGGMCILIYPHKSENTQLSLLDAVQSFIDNEMSKWAFGTEIKKMEIVYVNLPEQDS